MKKEHFMRAALERVIVNPDLIKNLGKVGVVANQTSATAYGMPAVEVVDSMACLTSGTRVMCVFGPQHGYFQTEQDNMRETLDGVYTLASGRSIPLFSLYTETREPTQAQMAQIDTLVVDLQDIGCRVYTYMLTLAACLRAAAKYGKRVVVLDRPNPLGLAVKETQDKCWRYVEGNRLETRWSSFVGWYDIPLRHGLTLGELGRYFIASDRLDIEYRVIRVENLSRKHSVPKILDSAWSMPSPNIPSWHSAFFFPSFVCLEGTNISEGRGTTIPFQLIGAPWLNAQKCLRFLEKYSHVYSYDAAEPSGLALREHHFRPTFNKHMGEICVGLQFYARKNMQNINLFALGMLFLYFCCLEHGEQLTWAKPGYEYNFHDLPLNLILGSEMWHNLFENTKKSQSRKDSLEDGCEALISLLQKSEKESAEFLDSVDLLFLY